jgi:hypothetical protein
LNSSHNDWFGFTVGNIRTLACRHELAMNAFSAHIHASIHMQLLPGHESAERRKQIDHGIGNVPDVRPKRQGLFANGPLIVGRAAIAA